MPITLVDPEGLPKTGIYRLVEVEATAVLS